MDPGDRSRPVKENPLAQPAQGRQAVPGARQDASAAESSTAELKEPIEEKTAGPAYTEKLTPAAETQALDGAGVDPMGIEKPRIEVEPEDTMISRKDNTDEGTAFRDPPLPPLPVIGDPVYTTEPAGEGSSKLSNIQVLVQAPTPVIGQDEQEAISDRTPQQPKIDSDIEMADAPPPVPMVDDPVVGPDEVHAGSEVDLPPPPPLAEASTTNAQAQGTPGVITPTEKQQWLLPPIQPRFHGKKCLVLDLDETLVHSSFKVRMGPRCSFSQPTSSNPASDSSSSGLYDTGGNRGSVPQRIRNQKARRGPVHEACGRVIRSRRLYRVCLKGANAIHGRNFEQTLIIETVRRSTARSARYTSCSPPSLVSGELL